MPATSNTRHDDWCRLRYKEEDEKAILKKKRAEIKQAERKHEDALSDIRGQLEVLDDHEKRVLYKQMSRSKELFTGKALDCVGSERAIESYLSEHGVSSCGICLDQIAERTAVNPPCRESMYFSRNEPY